MSDSCRRSLLIALSIVAMMMFAVAAFAECDTDCDPYYSYCSDECDVCTHWNQDGCDRWRASTCGNHMAACLQDNCTPNWVETGRTNYGTYDGRSLTSCDHHSVDLVTQFDYNECNINSSYWTHSFCQDYIDGHKYNECCYPSCCSGTNQDYPYNTLSCNGNHSCS